MTLTASKEMAIDLQKTAVDSEETVASLWTELNELNSAKEAVDVNLAKVQSALGKAMVENEFLKVRADGAEENVQLQMDRRSETESSMSKRVDELQATLHAETK